MSACNAGDLGLSPRLGRSPGEQIGYLPTPVFLGFPGGLDDKESACNVGDLGLSPRLGRSPGGGHGTHSCILAWRISMDRGAWQAAVHRVAKSWT